ncbi:MAG: twin-arginine translocation signal domain-containing protein [Elusimicrobia bacterium]|nr:twin-arginine translocation signal domain-containing protein [Elusimicrobiota bacterium]
MLFFLLSRRDFMKAGCAISFIAVTGIMIYGMGVVKK